MTHFEYQFENHLIFKEIVFPQYHSVFNLNCSDLETNKTQMEEFKNFLSEESILERTSNCESYFDLMPNEALRNINKSDHSLKLAFSHLVHKEIGILEIFLAIIFR